MTKRIVVDRKRCTGLGMCEESAPGVFEIQDDGTMKVLQECPSVDRLKEVEAAVEGCPTEALSLVDD
ncbi:MAG TPA: ferredoxin [Sporichthyaceae bacterium]|jgi:ferredoxin|nr:ferredoxin [Sporichthyaceae bacterium]